MDEYEAGEGAGAFGERECAGQAVCAAGDGEGLFAQAAVGGDGGRLCWGRLYGDEAQGVHEAVGVEGCEHAEGGAGEGEVAAVDLERTDVVYPPCACLFERAELHFKLGEHWGELRCGDGGTHLGVEEGVDAVALPGAHEFEDVLEEAYVERGVGGGRGRRGGKGGGGDAGEGEGDECEEERDCDAGDAGVFHSCVGFGRVQR